MNVLLDTLSWISLVIGTSVIITGSVGLVRFPDFFTRLHAVSVIDTLAIMLIVAGLVLQSGWSLVSVKLLLIVFFILFTSPAAAHAVAKSALHGKLQPVEFKKGESSS
ncbi:MAG TPA: monovalent cation/H(+) antiporter subunit G [Gammaproteobacteria bacterium]|nr:monovalent cation/H(+) antiporter subunit G [Gammaproteobacteria bacterium]